MGLRANALLLAAAVAAAALLAGGASAAPSPPLPPLAGYQHVAEAADVARELAVIAKVPKKRQALFDGWRRAMGKRYLSAGEYSRRYGLWGSQLDAMVAWNQRPGVRFFKAMNRFSDLTPAEMSVRVMRAGARLPRNTSGPGALPGGVDVASLPEEFDWRTFRGGNVPLVRDQGGCGSCWAHAVLAAAEIQARIHGVEDGPNLSEQQLIDCVNAASGYAGTNGCGTGHTEDAADYITKLYAVSESNYPYIAKNGRTCRALAAPTDGAVGIAGWHTVAGDPASLAKAVYEKGPVVVYFHADDDFKAYGGGIFTGPHCPRRSGNHAMTIVGFNRAEKFWVLRNSWGADWGEGGYMRVSTAPNGDGVCSMYYFDRFVLDGPRGPEVKPARFDNPLWKGTPIDACRLWASQCGMPAARRFCQLQGYRGVLEVGRKVPAARTVLPDANKGCVSSPAAGSCETFEYVVCGNQEPTDPVKFVSPVWRGLPLDYCANFSKDCGLPAANAWCAALTGGGGMRRAVAIGANVPAPGRRSALINGENCDADFCSTFADVTCGP